MTYDTKRLADLGRKHRKLKADLDALRAEIVPEIIAADLAGLQQKDIAELSDYTRESIRQICLTDEQREDEREKRRARTRGTKTKAGAPLD